MKEFGFSRAVEQLCPQDWKAPLGKAWQETLDFIIVKESPESYIVKSRTVVSELDPRIQLGAQIGMLNRRMFQEFGVKLKDLEILKSVYAVYINNKVLISKLTEDQRKLIEKTIIILEVN